MLVTHETDIFQVFAFMPFHLKKENAIFVLFHIVKIHLKDGKSDTTIKGYEFSEKFLLFSFKCHNNRC